MSFPLRVFWLLFWLLALPARAAEISLALDSIRHDAFDAEGVTLSFDTDRRGEADIRLGRLRVGSLEYRELRLHCSGFYFDGRRLDCPAGTLRRDDARGRDRPLLPFSFAWRADDGFVEFVLKDADVVVLSPLIKRLRGWVPAGRVDFRLAMRGDQAELRLALRDLGFANKAGDVKGKGIAMTLDARAERRGAAWRWQARLDWPRGELAFAPWRRAAALRAEAEGELTETTLQVDLARLELEGTGALAASLRWDRERGEATDWGFVTEHLDLGTAMGEWGQPWLAAQGLPVWRSSGKAMFAVDWRAGRLRRFFAGLDGATLADATGHVELRGVHAHIPWEADGDTEAEFGIGAGRLGDLPLGDFSFPLRIAGGKVAVRNLVAPMLDGRFEVEALTVARKDGNWEAEFAGGIEDVSMPKLSRALALPVMDGKLTARIPRISLTDEGLALDGALSIEVFGGGILVHRLRVKNPFSADRHFLADVTARNLELGMLTRTFSWGSIEGRFDADLQDLEMAGWKPLRFDARIASSPGEYPKTLSLGALKDITSLGEEGAIAGIAERAIGGFGYARIGIGCRLRNGVCQLEGVGREGDGIVLMEGRGIPAVSIIGYNRRIDWEALVARIREVIAGKPGVLFE